MHSPQISIIVPVYNAEKYVVKCLENIVSQEFSDWECIVVNDGSTDGTSKCTDDYIAHLENAGQRISIIEKNNGGVSSARNLGLERAKGEWICFIDVDDVISDNFFSNDDFSESSDLILKNIKYSNSNNIYHRLDAGVIESRNLKDFLAQKLYLSHFLVPWAKLFRRDIIIQNNIRFDTQYKFGEDTLFVESYLRHVKTLLISKCGIYHYTFTPYNKYILTVAKCIDYMHDFEKTFFALNIECPEMVKRVLIWHSGFCSDFVGMKKLLWYTDSSVNRLYRYACPLFPFATQLKIGCYTLLSKFRH